MGRPSLIEVGSKNGKLTILSIESGGGAGKHARAICKCDCGVVTQVPQHSLKKMKSCGCSQYDKEFIKKRDKDTYKVLDKGVAMMNSFFYSYKHHAGRRKLDFTITKEQFISVVFCNCVYCGTEPAYRAVHRKDGSEMYNGGILVNGIDRVDNSKGYTFENIAACCTTCNLSKHTRSKEDFLLHCLKVVNNSSLNNMKDCKNE